MAHSVDCKLVPLIDDTEARQWCYHEEMVVRFAALQTFGKEKYQELMCWLSDSGGSHSNAILMNLTLSADKTIMWGPEKIAVLLLGLGFSKKARQSEGWVETRETLVLEFDLLNKCVIAFEAASDENAYTLARIETISKHVLLADDSLRIAQGLFPGLFKKMGGTAVYPCPTPEDIMSACNLQLRMGVAYAGSARSDGDHTGAHAECTLVFGQTLIAGALVPMQHWPEITAKAMPLLGEGGKDYWDNCVMLDCSRHTLAWLTVGMCFDAFTVYDNAQFFCEMHGDLTTGLKVLDKQMAFSNYILEQMGASANISGIGPSCFFPHRSRQLGRSKELWAQIQAYGISGTYDEIYPIYANICHLGWRTADGKHSMADAAFFCLSQQFTNYLVAPLGTFDRDEVLSQRKEPSDSFFDDNFTFHCAHRSSRELVGECLASAGMFEEAIAQVQPALVFNQINVELRVSCMLLLGYCHGKPLRSNPGLLSPNFASPPAELGQSQPATVCFDDALKESQRTGLFLSQYRALAHLKRHVIDKAATGESSKPRGRLLAARERLKGPAELLDVIGQASYGPDGGTSSSSYK
jgi:hypothetical protein